MPKNFAFEISTPAGIILPMRVEFRDDEWERIEAFLEFANELAEHSLVKKDFWPAARFFAGTKDNPGKVTSVVAADGEIALSVEGGAPLDADTSTFPDRQEFESFMYRMRRFVLQKAEARTYFPSILKLFSKKIPLPGWQQLLDRFTGRYSYRHMKVTVTKGGQPRELVSNVALDEWTNAFEQHRDPTEAAEFKEIPAEHLTPAAIRALMLELIAEQATAVLLLGKTIDALKRGGGTISFGPSPAPTSS